MKSTVFIFADYQQLIRDVIEQRGGPDVVKQYDEACERGGKVLSFARALKSAGQPVHIVHVIVDGSAGQVRDASLYASVPSDADGQHDPSTHRKALRAFAKTCEEKYGGKALISAPVTPLDDEKIMGRPTASAFFDTPLAQELRQLGVEEMVICGVATSGIVIASVQGANERGLSSVVVEDGCMDFGDMHKAVMTYLAKRCKVIQIASIGDEQALMSALEQES